ncbi:unnamed protein product [Hymenolepis diminuta]|uniref:Secreted protein n=1 Tax=Hymenolepis diminuta TaxID=6216 RepID=A0A0R3SPE4_HYMDI|nr:unnamed protein product [Hymenolepis diminuta]
MKTGLLFIKAFGARSSRLVLCSRHPLSTGLLPHSPPGRNKSSFITALANWCCAFIFLINDSRSKFTWSVISVCLISMKWACQLVGWSSMKIN